MINIPEYLANLSYKYFITFSHIKLLIPLNCTVKSYIFSKS